MYIVVVELVLSSRVFLAVFIYLFLFMAYLVLYS